MAGPELKVGAVIHIRDFQFSDGSRANKYFVILGIREAREFLCVRATSRQWRMGFTPGCHHKPRTYFFIAGDGKNFFPKDTWLILSDPHVFSAPVLIQGRFDGRISVEHNLSGNFTGYIRNCLKASQDASPYHLAILDAK